MKNNYEKWFLNPGEQSEKKFSELMDHSISLISDELLTTEKLFSGSSRKEIESMVKELSTIPENGQKMEDVMKDIRKGVIEHSLNISNPSAMAHLHCPPMLPSIAAEMIIGALNQSMDSWDQSPAATYVEEEVLQFFTDRIGYQNISGGTFTSGGTQSNYMGLLLARNQACSTHFAKDVHREGLPAEASKLRILCSEHGHFTVQQSAAQLGLGIDSVVKVKTDDQQQLCLEDAGEKLEQLRQQGLIPFMIVATAGTTDFGSIDNIREIADLATDCQLWLHVDAAYGGALLFSHDHAHNLAHLWEADSIAIDFHKLYYQSISCGAFFVKDRQSFQHITLHADYLNPKEDDEAGIINLVEKSVQTSKRFDALKILMTFKLMGTETFGEMIDDTILLAADTAQLLRQNNFEVFNEPKLNAVLFRYIPEDEEMENQIDEINLELQRYFYQSGELIMAKTRQAGNVYLKFTMLNPLNTIERMQDHIEILTQKAMQIRRMKREEMYGHSIHN